VKEGGGRGRGSRRSCRNNSAGHPWEVKIRGMWQRKEVVQEREEVEGGRSDARVGEKKGVFWGSTPFWGCAGHVRFGKKKND